MKTMKRLLIITLLCGSAAQAQDNNIISFIAGQGPSGVEQTVRPGSNSSTTSVSCKPGKDCDDSSTTNTTVNPASGSLGQGYGLITGIMYQRRIEDSPLLLGGMALSNKTYAVIMGVSF